MTHLNTDLMTSASVQLDFGKCKPVFFVEHLVFEFGKFCAVNRLSANVNHVVYRVFLHIIGQSSLIFFRFAHKYGEVFFLETSRLHLLGKPARRFTAFCIYHHSARNSVESVDKPYVYVALLVFFFLDMFFNNRKQVHIFAFILATRHVLRFKHNDYMIVFV